jgi:hypothetical protein
LPFVEGETLRATARPGERSGKARNSSACSRRSSSRRAELRISTFRTSLTSSRQAMGPPEALKPPNGGRCELVGVAAPRHA